MKPFLVVIFSLILGGCATQREEIRPDVTPFTPTSTLTQTRFKDSVVVRWIVRDSTVLHDSTVVNHTAVADATDFYIYSGTFINSHGDSNFVTLDSQTGMGTLDTHYGTYEVAHNDTTHTVVTTPPAEFGLLDKIGLGAICFLAGIIATLAAKNNFL